jgi:hypothetical protein
MKVYYADARRTVLVMASESINPRQLLNYRDTAIARYLRDGPLAHGFNWGYVGDASLDLAYSILYDLAGESTANRYAEQFQYTIIAGLPQGHDWHLFESDIQAALRRFEAMIGAAAS